MTRAAMLSVVLAACSSSGSEGPRSDLQVTLGSAGPTSIAATVTSNMMGSRFFMQATDGHVTVIVSLQTPVTARQVDVASQTEVASVWGQLDAMPPILARAGTLAIEGSGNVFDFQFTDVSKPMDVTGPSLLITGTMTGVDVPQ